MLKLMNGRPVTNEGRLPKEIRCYDLLDSLEVSYQRIDHEAAMTMEACVEIDKALDAVICKNLLLCNRQKTAFYLLMLPGEKHFKTSTFSKTIGSSRLSFADPEYMEQFLDITPGSVSVLVLMNDHDNRVQLIMDEDILKGEYSRFLLRSALVGGACGHLIPRAGCRVHLQYVRHQKEPHRGHDRRGGDHLPHGHVGADL